MATKHIVQFTAPKNKITFLQSCVCDVSGLKLATKHVVQFTAPKYKITFFQSCVCDVCGLKLATKHGLRVHKLVHQVTFPIFQVRGSQPFSSAYPFPDLRTLRTFCVPPGYNFCHPRTPNTIIRKTLCYCCTMTISKYISVHVD